MDAFDFIFEFVGSGLDLMFQADLNPVARVLRNLSAVLIVVSVVALVGILSGHFFIFSAGRSNKTYSAVFVQLRPFLEPPWGIKIGKNSSRTNNSYTWKFTPVLDDGIFAGI